jgi:hypothetical protein
MIIKAIAKTVSFDQLVAGAVQEFGVQSLDKTTRDDEGRVDHGACVDGQYFVVKMTYSIHFEKCASRQDAERKLAHG